MKFNFRLSDIDKLSFWCVFISYILSIYLDLKFDYACTHALVIICGMLFFVKLSHFICYNEFLHSRFEKLAQWTFIIYVGHELALTGVKKIFFKILPTTPIFLFCEYLFLPIIIITGCIIVGIILKKYTPKIYGIITGSR